MWKFASVTPISTATGVPIGQPILVNLALVKSLELIAAGQSTVAFTQVAFTDGTNVQCSDLPTAIVPTVDGQGFRV